MSDRRIDADNKDVNLFVKNDWTGLNNIVNKCTDKLPHSLAALRMAN